MMNRSSNLIVDGAGLIAVITLALIVRFHAITVPSVWYDEAFSLLLAKETPWQIWTITARDVHPPLYYVFLHYWMLLFGNGVLSVRSLSALADVGTLLLCVKLMSLVATRRATWIAALLLALLPISVRYSQEVRMYTLVSFWLMGATVALVCWVKAPEQKRFPLIYVLLMTAAFYTHYFAALCVLVHWHCWWCSRRSASGTVIAVRWWIGVNSLIVLLYLPWLPHFIHQMTGMNGLEWIPPVTWQSVATIVWQFTVMNDGVAESSWWRIVPLVLILGCAATAVLSDQSEQRFSRLLIDYFFIPLIVLFLVALIVPVFVPRYLVFAAVGLPMICAVAVDTWGRQRPLLVAVAVVFFVMGQLQGLRAVYSQEDGLNGTALRKDFRVDTLAAEINRQARPNDTIVFDTLMYYLPFWYYNTTGIQPRFYIASSMDEVRGNDQGGYALIPQHLKWIFFDEVGVLKLNAGRIWWVTDKEQTENTTVLPKQWKQTVTLDGGEVEARLFTFDTTPTSPEAGAQSLLTQRPLH
ncbi:glycosyltransferase family 39 protein [Pseudomonas sp. A-RE-19]|uniref:glycosyltransferase family 39 protein n=1 Tax=Pseudomonas sp. A-RE-19 TaxID=2832401 RepID=UPI001CBF038D|nr:glycosyltransferase family 39 protein [Pseudomonas sp. A-RE-19]